MSEARKSLQELLSDHAPAIVQAWLNGLGLDAADGNFRTLNEEAEGVLAAIVYALKADRDADIQSSAWVGVRSVLESLAGTRAAQGRTVGETCAFVMGLKRPLFLEAQQRSGKTGKPLVNLILALSEDVDAMAQWVADTFQRAREGIITRQQDELLELSTPVIKLWDGILAVPMIGTLDSSRTQLVMEALLQRIVETESTIAIIDITGVPTVDTLVAQHLLKTVTAIRLLGAECIISGIRPQIAQTVVHLGIDLQGVNSKSTLAGALTLALKQTGYTVERKKKPTKKSKNKSRD